MTSLAPTPRPEGRIAWATTPAGERYRYGHWPAPDRPRGTAVLLGGRSEFLEKHLETVSDLQERGYAVWSLDWLGQGRSQRLAPAGDRRGHIADFAQYREQLAHLLARVVAWAGGERLLIAHSMGGNAALHYLSAYRAAAQRPRFDRVVLTAPMLSIKLPWRAIPVARLLARWAVRSGRGGDYALGQGPGTVNQRFADNPLTADPTRFARTMTWLDAQPELRTDGVTWAWLDAACRACARLDRHAARAIPEPVLMLSAGRDTVVGSGAQRRFAAQLPVGHRLTIPDSRHEILTETDNIRARAWAAIDAFLNARPLPSGRPDRAAPAGRGPLSSSASAAATPDPR